MERRSIVQWLWCINDDVIRESAFRNFRNYFHQRSPELQILMRKTKYSSFITVIDRAFAWNRTTEGSNFWVEFGARTDVYTLKTL